MEETRHRPVLLQEAVKALCLKSGDTVVDATLGGGGHARAILSRILPGGRVIAIDADETALVRFRDFAQADETVRQALADKSLTLVHENYSSLGGVLEREGVGRCDAILADLGFSSDQIEAGERGFSFLRSGPLDMRLDRTTGLTAENIVNAYSPEEISRILRDYGEESESWRIAQAIVAARALGPIATTDELRAIVGNAYPAGKRRRMKIDPATKTFQALRIAVNREFEHLEAFLAAAIERLKSGGRLAVIAFHSGEDALVKRCFKDKAQGCICPPQFPVCRCGRKPLVKILTKKPIVPSEKEVAENPRARSAKMRIIERL
ncbi:MAG: 16S rRNA (cytosine(1402)-N(4))-methyltransferase RsmH [Candidatus Moraniibacteriota bacterium]